MPVHTFCNYKLNRIPTEYPQMKKWGDKKLCREDMCEEQHYWSWRQKKNPNQPQESDLLFFSPKGN